MIEERWRHCRRCGTFRVCATATCERCGRPLENATVSLKSAPKVEEPEREVVRR